MAERVWSSPRLFASYSGDVFSARRLTRRARICIGYLFDQLRPGQTYRTQTWTYTDGSRIQVAVLRDVLGERAVAKIFSPSKQEDAQTDFGFIFWPHRERDIIELTLDLDKTDAEFNDLLFKVYKNNNGIMFSASKDTALDAGPVNWHGYGTTDLSGQLRTISWDHGLPTRYRLASGHNVLYLSDESGQYNYLQDVSQRYEVKIQEENCSDTNVRNPRYNQLFFNGRLISIGTQFQILGAGLWGDVIIFAAQDGVFSRTSFYTVDPNEEAPVPSLIGTYSIATPFRAPWKFSPTGTKAATVVSPDEFMAGIEWPTRYQIHRIEFFINSSGERDFNTTVNEIKYSSLIDKNTSETYQVLSNTSSAECEPYRFKSITAYTEGQETGFSGLSAMMQDAITQYCTALDDTYPSAAPHTWKDPEVFQKQLNELEISLSSCSFPAGYGVAAFTGLAYIQRGVGSDLRFLHTWVYTRESSFNSEFKYQYNSVRPDMSGGRLVAVDYDMSGNELIIEQFRTFPEANLETIGTSTIDKFTYKYGSSGYFGEPKISTEQNIVHTGKMEIVCDWKMTINGDPWLTTSGQASMDAQMHFRSYNDGINPTEVAFAGSGEAVESYDDIFILDCDARFKSLLYVKSHFEKSYGPPLQQEPGNWRLPVKQQEVTRSIIFSHQGIEHVLYEMVFDPAQTQDFRLLYAGASHLHGANEGVEGYNLTECLNYGGGGSSGVTARVPGSLCVNKDGHAAIYANNLSGWRAAYNEDFVDINRIIISDSGDIFTPIATIENALQTAFLPANVRIAPIRTT